MRQYAGFGTATVNNMRLWTAKASRDFNLRDFEFRVPAAEFAARRRGDVKYTSGIGLGIGLFLAFALEFFNRKIRYKRDIENELGLTVVGVIPEN